MTSRQRRHTAAGIPTRGVDDAVRYARQLLADAREERALADQKASVLFAAVWAVAGIVVAIAISRQWSPLGLGLVPAVLCCAGAVSVTASVVLLGAAVYPRLGRRPTRNGATVSSFREIARCENPSAVRRAVEQSSAYELDGLSEQLLNLGRLTCVKYGCIQAALWLLGLSIGLIVLAAGLTLT